jgi:hypothetical protein
MSFVRTSTAQVALNAPHQRLFDHHETGGFDRSVLWSSTANSEQRRSHQLLLLLLMLLLLRLRLKERSVMQLRLLHLMVVVMMVMAADARRRLLLLLLLPAVGSRHDQRRFRSSVAQTAVKLAP